MPTDAEKVVEKNSVPSNLKERADEVTQVCKDAWALPEDHPVHNSPGGHPPHAYSYEVMGDDSVVALYANTKDGKIKMKAFESLEEASRWTPREEKQQ